MMWNKSLYGKYYRQITFTDVWEDANSFINDYNNNGIETTISRQTATTLYYLLYSRYGNSVIASSDTNRFKYDVFATIFSYGPTWEKRLELQEKLRDISDNDLFTGATQIYNHAYNPGTSPSTSTLNELPAINEQNTSKHKKDKLSAYAMLISLLETDVTESFLDKFRKLFITIVQPELPLWYSTEIIDDDVIGD